MGIIFKNTLSNVLANKRRSALLIICMMVVAFSAMTAFSMSDTIGIVIDDFVSQTYGDAQVLVDNDSVNTKLLELPDYARGLYFYNMKIHTQKHSADNFAYAAKTEYMLMGVDIEQAQAERFFLHDEHMTLGEDEIIISEKLATAENWDIGSTIDVMTKNGEDVTLTVKYIIKNERYIKDRGAVAIANASLVEKLQCMKGCWSDCNIFFDNDMNPNDFIAEYQGKYPSMNFDNLRLANDSMGTMRLMFMAIFLILALIIFIVTMGISEHIIRERMAQMGTLRSIGATRKMTSAALISENLFYSIPGAVIGIIIFIPFGKFFISDLFVSSGIPNVEFHAKPLYIVIVFLLTILISCLSSVKAVIKAINTPIRDIIFGGRDTAYELKKGKACAGLVLVVIGAVCGLCIENGVVILLSLLLFTAGSVMFIPMLLRFICKLFGKANDPIIRFSFNNIATKKTVISSAVLFAVVISLVSAVFMETKKISDDMAKLPMGGDIVINMLSDSSEQYRFIGALDEVERAELIYCRNDKYQINDNKPINFCYIMAYDPEVTMFDAFSGIEAPLAIDEISIDEKVMNAYKIKVGDVIDITFNLDGERPIALKLKTVKPCNTGGIDFDRASVVISPELYKKYFFDTPYAINVKLKDASKADEVVSTIKTYLMDKSALILSRPDYIVMQTSGGSGIQSLLYIIIGTGCLLSLIMLSTNLTIGFEQRKKELAVLHSTSMSRAQLGRMLFCETALSLAISSVWAIISGAACYTMIVRFVAALDEVPPTMPENLYLTFILPVVMLGAAAIVSAFSRNKVNKMNTANEMKYE